jgi:ParB/RepB/Spo0J family partition protein
MEQIQYFPPERLKTVPQIRTRNNPEIVRAVAQTMREVGQLQAIRARLDGEDLIVVDGHTRLDAAKLAGLATVAVIIEEKPLCEGEVIHRQLIANCQREELTPMEKAKAISRLLTETGWTATQAAEKLGFSNSTLSRLLALLELPEPIRRQVETGAIAYSAATELGRVKDEAQQSELAGQVAGGLTRDALSGSIKAGRNSTAARIQDAPTRVTALLGAGRSITLSGPGLTLESLIAWLEDLLARARKVRPQGLELRTFIKMLQDQSKT